MKFIIAILLIINPLTYVSQINQNQMEAEKAFQRKNFAIAINRYTTLIKDFEIKTEELYLNLGHCYFELKDAEKASDYYLKLLEFGSGFSQSIALNQLGYIAEITQNPEKALDYFKQAIQKNTQNLEARYNYELVKKKLQNPTLHYKQRNIPNKQAQANEIGKGKFQQIEKKQANKDGKDKTTENTKNEEEKEKNLQPEKLEDAKLNKEKAEAILQALQNQETQYIQQLPRKRNNKQKTSPQSDW